MIHRPGQRINFVPGIGINVIVPQSAAAVGWWLSGGIPAANCIAAYRAISTPGSPWGAGPVDYATSKVNLAQPGVYDATEGVAPAWDAATGWTGDGTQWLKSNVNPGSNWSVFCMFSGAAVNDRFLFGRRQTSVNNEMSFAPRGNAGSLRLYRYGTSSGTGVEPAVTSGVAGIAGPTAYYNGAPIGTPLSAVISGNIPIYLFAINNNGTVSGILSCVIVAWAAYDIVLSGAQAFSLSVAMAAV